MPARKKTIAEINKAMAAIRRSSKSYRKQGRNKDGSRRMTAAAKRKLQSLGAQKANRKRRR